MLVGRQAHNWSGVEQDAMQSPDLTVARQRNISWPATGIMLEFVAGNWRIRAGSGPASTEITHALEGRRPRLDRGAGRECAHGLIVALVQVRRRRLDGMSVRAIQINDDLEVRWWSWTDQAGWRGYGDRRRAQVHGARSRLLGAL